MTSKDTAIMAPLEELGWEDARNVDLEAALRRARSRRRRSERIRRERRRDARYGLVVVALAAVCVWLGAGGEAWPATPQTPEKNAARSVR